MTTAEKIRAVAARYTSPTVAEVRVACLAEGIVASRPAVRSALRSRSGRRGPPRGKGVCSHCGAMKCHARKPVTT